MDYDDNNLHIQNFQLVGEDNNKFPSGLLSFPLPKLDLDDHSESHLRFDTVVETENLLRIPVKENNWIDSSSLITSALAFNSIVTESRYMFSDKNMWSEATSYESAEMLFKSVCEDDLINDSVSGVKMDDSVNLKDQENSCSGQDIFISDAEDIVRVDLSLPRDICEKSFSTVTNLTRTQYSLNCMSQPTSGAYPEIRSMSGVSDSNREILSEVALSSDVAKILMHNVTLKNGDDPRSVLGKPQVNSDANMPVSEIDSLSVSLSNLSHRESVFHKNSDGFLEDIAYLDKLWKEDDTAGVKVITSENLSNTVDDVTVAHEKEPSITDSSLNSDVIEHFEVSDCDQIERRSRKGSHDESSVFLQNIDRVASHAHVINVNVIDEKQEAKFHKIQGVNNYLRKSPVEAVAENSATGSMNQNAATEAKNGDASSMDYFDSFTLNSGPSVAKSCSKIDTEISIREPEIDTLGESPLSQSMGFTGLKSVQSAQMIALDHFPTGKMFLDEAGKAGANLPPSSSAKTSALIMIDSSGKEILEEMCTSGYSICYSGCAPSLTTIGSKSTTISSLETDLLNMEAVSLSSTSVTNVHEEDIFTPSAVEGDSSAKILLTAPHDYGESSSDSHVQSPVLHEQSTSSGKKYDNKDKLYPNLSTLANSDANGSLTGSVENAVLDTCFKRADEKVEISTGKVAPGTVPTADHQDKVFPVKFGIDEVNCSKFLPMQSFNVGKSDVECTLLEAKSGSSCCYEPNCGSPTVISCVDTPHDEVDHHIGNSRPSAQPDCIIDKHDADKIQSEGDVDHRTEDDMSFTFQVESFPNISEEVHEGNLIENSLVCDESNHVSDSKISVEDKSMPDSLGCNRKPYLSEDNKDLLLSEKDETKRTLQPNVLGDIKRDVESEEVSQHSNVNKDRMKSSGSLATAPVSAIADLNTSAGTSVLFHQPFTDIQQVQLRAQIFVYGFLIQGIPPDETCMLSAFGDSDGRTVWGGVLSVALERFESQKLPHDARTPEEVSRYNSFQNKLPSPHPGQHGGSLPVQLSPLFNSVSLSSPLWSLSSHSIVHSSMPKAMHLNFSQAAAPLYSSQSPQERQHVGNVGAQWRSESSRSPFGSIVGPSQSPRFDSTVQYSAVAIASTGAPITLVRALSVPQTSFVSAPTVGPESGSSAPAVLCEVKSKILTPGSSKHKPASQKVRRSSKKSAVLERIETICSPSIPSTENSALPDAAKIITSPVSSGGQTEKRMIISEESCIKTEQAKLQAEDAAAMAASAVKHSKSVWSRLSLQRDSLSNSEAEQKLASAAVVAAAAVAVAKAAAAAAKVAADAAVQAKMMADEAQNGPKHTNNLKTIKINDTEKCSKETSSISILRGRDKFPGNCTLVLTAAREAIRRRMESDSDAAKRVENLDAIERAVELVLEAISQAGAIVAMGDPLLLTISELVESGPEAYWKGYCPISQINSEGHGQDLRNGPEVNGAVSQNVPSAQLGDSSLDNDEVQRVSREEVKSSLDALLMLTEKDNTGHAPNNKTFRNLLNLERDGSQDWQWNTVKIGAVIEVVPDKDGLKGVWYSAQVLDLKDSEAYVCYDNLLNDEGSSQLTEWIPLNFDGNKPPRIRISHPIMTAKAEGVGKRQRDAMVNYFWAVGDHVDAWMRDGWWEGIVKENFKDDETKLIIHFPASGDTSVVRAWNLRPSLLWKDGGWIEWSRSRADNIHFHEGDTPNEKRQKLTNFVASTIGIDDANTDKISRNLEVERSGMPEESRPLDLSAVDNVFCHGRHVSNSDSNKIPRTGLRKGGSGVIFGVPKPGKKRKFMDVSRHYVEDRLKKTDKGNDVIKFAKYLMPQASHLLRNSSKVREASRPALNSKTKLPVPPARSQSIHSINVANNYSSSSSYTSFNSFGAEKGQLLDSHASFFRAGSKFDRNLLESNSFSIGSGPPDHSSAMDLPVQNMQTVPLSLKTVEEYTREKGKLISAMNKTTGNEEIGPENPGRSTLTETVEPRRSNRKIQPTSRLLEGLQSSLTVSKVPYVSYEKNSRSLHRGRSKGTT